MSILSDETTNDPLVRGYNGVGSENAGPGPMTDQELVNSLNAVNRSRNRTSMTGREVQAEIVDTDYDALVDPQLKAQVLALTAADDLDPFGFPANVIKDIFPGTATLAALLTVRVETISRAVEIGAGQVSLKTLRLQSIR